MNEIWKALRSMHWNGEESFSPANLQPEQLQKYIQKSIQQSLGEAFKINPISSSAIGGIDQGIQWDLVELMDYIIVKGEIPESINPREIWFSHTKSEFIIETGLKRARTIIALPSLVKEKGVYAKCKQRTFEVRLPKDRGGREKSIDVQWE